MKNNSTIIATGVLIFGLMVPSSMQARGTLRRGADNFVQAAAVSAGVHVAAAPAHTIGQYIANSIRGHEGKIILGGAIALVALYIYTSREEERENKDNHRARSCSKKECSHKTCK